MREGVSRAGGRGRRAGGVGQSRRQCYEPWSHCQRPLATWPCSCGMSSQDKGLDKDCKSNLGFNGGSVFNGNPGILQVLGA
jgi:hypothetical protein